ncbi:ShlB/FhaC/HecB family hemolysin secretion/activation protein, partial [Escherichia coli]|uniref:ShlB/FhaC/HecB family hemolysin secretion/activation protein n=1 Tax=Escherichia coli TaxID=562 RepID=UPI00111D393B
HIRTNNYLLDTRLGPSSNRLSEFQVGINHGRRIGSAFVNLDLGMQNGIGAFAAQSNDQERDREGNLTPTPNYRKYTATLSYLQPFTLWGESFSFSSLATGQRSEDVLFSPQRISLGGSASVRGYKDQQLTGDSGGYWRNDIRWARPVTWD